MKITQPKRPASLALSVSASGVTVSDPGGFYGGGPLTLEDILALIGAGTSPDAFYLNTLGGKDVIQDLGTLGATATCDMANASVFLGELAEDVDISFTGWTTGRRCTIGVSLTEDGTGTWTPTFLGVTWVGGTPTWDTTAGTFTDVVLWSDDGGTLIKGVVVGAGGGSSSLTVEDEGTPLAGAADTLDFVGAGVTASGTGTTKTITIPGPTGGPGGSGGLVLLETHTASASATLDFTSCISSTYDLYYIEIDHLKPATNSVTLVMRFSTDGGSTYIATSTYQWSHWFIYGAVANGVEGNVLDTSIAVSGGQVASAGVGVWGSAQLIRPLEAGTTYKTVNMDVTREHTSVGLVHDAPGIGYLPVAAINAFRFLFTSGNITSGTIRVYGVVKT